LVRERRKNLKLEGGAQVLLVGYEKKKRLTGVEDAGFLEGFCLQTLDGLRGGGGICGGGLKKNWRSTRRIDYKAGEMFLGKGGGGRVGNSGWLIIMKEATGRFFQD